MMVISQSSKCPKTSKDFSNDIDRISNLPDHLISRILSLLPTKYVVATSILSTRWKFLWTSITNLDFKFYCNRINQVNIRNKTLKKSDFTLFINRVLFLQNAPIQNFSLDLCHPDCIDPSDLIYWMSVGFGRTFSKFYLSFMSGAMDFPVSPIYCNVSVLDLSGNIEFIIPASASLCFPSVQSLYLTDLRPIIADNSSISFPNLKKMDILFVLFKNVDSIHKFLSSSPVLDELIIESSVIRDRECLIICIPSLTRLSIDCHPQVLKIKIDSPALQYLKLNDYFHCQYLPGQSLSFLLQAVVHVHFPNENNANVESFFINILGRLSNVKFLLTSGFIMKAFRTALSHITLDFPNLTRLEIEQCDCIDLCLLINNALGKMDNLEHIFVEGDLCRRYFCAHQSCWSGPLNVPKCFLSRVTTVSFHYMNVECCNQIEVLKYILKNAQVLQLLSIRINRMCEKKQLEFVKKISSFPRGSRTCQIAFT